MKLSGVLLLIAMLCVVVVLTTDNLNVLGWSAGIGWSLSIIGLILTKKGK